MKSMIWDIQRTYMDWRIKKFDVIRSWLFKKLENRGKLFSEIIIMKRNICNRRNGGETKMTTHEEKWVIWLNLQNHLLDTLIFYA
jgi:hypothetical protein